jgi:hypothetical protein
MVVNVLSSSLWERREGVFDERQAVSGGLSLPRRYDCKVAEVWSVGGLNTVMAVACHQESMSVRVWLLHDLVVHELLELLLAEAMHQLARLVRRLEVLAVLAHFVDVYLRSCQPPIDPSS